MKEIYQTKTRNILLFLITAMTFFKLEGQSSLPETFSNGTLKDQLNYIDEKTRIYENYRAIREDMYQKIKGNITDSLIFAKNEVSLLTKKSYLLNHTMDSLNTVLKTTKNSLAEMTATKNSISVIGFNVNKVTYNSIMWAIGGSLILLLGIGFMVFKRNMSVTANTRKDLQELKNEFEAYRKTTREAREKMAMDHFNEIRKLKGG